MQLFEDLTEISIVVYQNLAHPEYLTMQLFEDLTDRLVL
jgi:hypothetical protein